MLIGISGKARSGKDTVAQYLVDRHGFEHMAFADALKGAAREIFGLSEEQMYGDEKEKPDPFWKATPREILQKLGTECLRNGFRDDVWIEALRRRIWKIGPEPLRVVVSDVRFLNEASAIQSWGGVVWRIERPGVAAVRRHVSETELDGWRGWDAEILNGSTLENLHARVDYCVARLFKGDFNAVRA